MDRRKFLIGAGSLAAGGAAAMGSGAFTAMTASRGASINVVNDSTGLLQLNATHESDLVSESDGELSISIDGVNVNSIYQIGSSFKEGDRIYESAGEQPSSNSPTGNAAFVVTNTDSEPKAVTLGYKLDEEANLNENGSELFIDTRARPGDSWEGGDGGPSMTIDHNNTEGEISFPGNYNGPLKSGGGFGVSLIIDTTGEGASTSENLSGTFTVTAEEVES